MDGFLRLVSPRRATVERKRFIEGRVGPFEAELAQRSVGVERRWRRLDVGVPQVDLEATDAELIREPEQLIWASSAPAAVEISLARVPSSVSRPGFSGLRFDQGLGWGGHSKKRRNT